jgi:hypothetical protein
MTKASVHRAPVLVTRDDPDAERRPSFALGTPDPNCRTEAAQACTASINLDPTDALLSATTRAGRTFVVEPLTEEAIQ